MKKSGVFGTMLAVATAFSVVLLGPAPLAGQGKGKGPVAFEMPQKGEIPRTTDGLPDLNGVWMRPYVPDMTKGGRNNTPSNLNFTDWGKGKWDNYSADDGDYAGACFPFGLVRSINAPHPMQIIMNKDWVAFLHEQDTWFTKVKTDGAKLPDREDLFPQWFGTTVGRWEGDTLVLESTGFNGKTRLDTIGHPHSEQMYVKETWTLMNENQVYYTMEINDPRTYKEPFKSERIFNRDPEGEVMEYSCIENNKSLWEGRIKIPDFEEWLR